MELRAEGEPALDSTGSLELQCEPKYEVKSLPVVMTEEVLDKYIENLRIMHRIADIKSQQYGIEKTITQEMEQLKRQQEPEIMI